MLQSSGQVGYVQFSEKVPFLQKKIDIPNEDLKYYNLFLESKHFHLLLTNTSWEFLTFKKPIIDILNIEINKEKYSQKKYEELIAKYQKKYQNYERKWLDENSPFRKS